MINNKLLGKNREGRGGDGFAVHGQFSLKRSLNALMWIDNVLLQLLCTHACVRASEQCVVGVGVGVVHRGSCTGTQTEKVRLDQWERRIQNQQREPKHAHYTEAHTHTGTNWCCTRVLLYLAALLSRSFAVLFAAQCLLVCYFHFFAFNWEALLFF